MLKNLPFLGERRSVEVLIGEAVHFLYNETASNPEVREAQ